MNKELINNILKIYNDILDFNFINCPQMARERYIKINYILITLLNYMKLKNKFQKTIENNDNIKYIFKNLKELNFITQEEEEFIIEFLHENIINLNELFKILKTNNVHEYIFEFYEEILSLDIVLNNNKYTIIKENNSRDRLGAYYTSDDLANEVIEKTLKKYLIKKLNVELNELEFLISKKNTLILHILKESKFVDLSCGTGHFIIALINFLEKIAMSQDDLENMLFNIFGFDVDFVALQIIKTEILIKSNNLNNILKIHSNFILGNTLIDTPNNNYFEKISLISKGYINHLKLGINQKEYEKLFDVIIGNPPWEKIRFEDKNFFSNYCPNIAKITKKDERKKEIDNLENTNPNLMNYYKIFNEELEKCKNQIKQNERFKNSANGELNTYSLFTELAINFLSEKGYIGIIVKSSLITSVSNSKLFLYLLNNQMIVSLDDFINKLKIFPIDSRERFSVIILSKYKEKNFNLKMMLKVPKEINDYNISEIILDKNLLNKINPKTYMIPNISSNLELKLLISLYSKFNIFEKEFPKSKFGRLVHLTSHSKYIHRSENSNNIPIYEGKFIEIYDNKFSTFENINFDVAYTSKASARLMTNEEKIKRNYYPKSRYFIEKEKWNDITKKYPNKYSIVWRSLTSASNKRVTLASLLPHCPTIQSIQLLQYEDNYEILLIILSLFNSAIFDFIVKLKLNGIDLTQTIIKQIPVPSIIKFEETIIFKGIKASIKHHIFQRISSLYKFDDKLDSFFTNIPNLNNLEKFDLKNRRNLILELDFLIFKVYDVNTVNEITTIIKEFPKYYSQNDLDYILSFIQ